MQLSKTRKGEISIFAESVLWAAFPVVSVLVYQFVSPLFAIAWTTFFSAVFFGFLLLVQKKWKELKVREAWLPIMLATFLNGVCYYAIFFLGLQKTTAGNAAIIAEMEIWFSFVFFGLILRKEKYTKEALLGVMTMFIGVLFVLFPGELRFNIGDLLILVAALFPPAGNHFQQLARQKVSAVTLLFVRNIVASVFLFALANFFEVLTVQDFYQAVPFLLINGFLLLGFSKILFIEAIHRIPVAKAISLSTFIPVFTLIYAFVFLHEIPTTWQFIGLPFVLGGAILIVRNDFLHEPPPID